MSRYTEIVVHYSGDNDRDHTELVGAVALKEGGRLEYESFNVVTWIGGLDYDVTGASSIQKSLEHFKKYFESQLEKYWDDLIFERDGAREVI